jgi:hypothetical protein
LADIFEGMGEGMAEWIVMDPSGDQTTLQLAYFDRAQAPVIMEAGPPTAPSPAIMLISSEICGETPQWPHILLACPH